MGTLVEEQPVTFDQLPNLARILVFSTVRNNHPDWDDLYQEALIEGWRLLDSPDPPGLPYFRVAMRNRIKDMLMGDRKGIRPFGSELGAAKEFAKEAGEQTRERMHVFRRDYYRMNGRYPTQEQWAAGVGIAVSSLREHIPRMYRFSLAFESEVPGPDLVEKPEPVSDVELFEEDLTVAQIISLCDASEQQKHFMYYVAFEGFSIKESMRAAGYSREKLATTSRKQLQQSLLAAGLKG